MTKPWDEIKAKHLTAEQRSELGDAQKRREAVFAVFRLMNLPEPYGLPTSESEVLADRMLKLAAVGVAANRFRDVMRASPPVRIDDPALQERYVNAAMDLTEALRKIE